MLHLSRIAILLALPALPAAAEQIISEDLILDGNLCVGQACTSNDASPDTPIKIKSVTPSIRFRDTSSSTFPNRDWRIQVNDPGSNGTEYFGIFDEDANTMPVRVEGGTPSNSLYVANTGHVGLGTSIPQADLHIATPNTPGIRLEQDGSGSFQQAAWDILANHGNFYIRSGVGIISPFVISASAAHNSFRIGADGDIAMGIASAAAALHLRRNDNTAAMLIEDTGTGTLGQLTLRNNGITYFTLEDTSIAAGDNTGRAWNFQNQNGSFRVTTAPGGPGEIEMQMTPAGDMYLKGELFTGTGGGATTCASGCDAVFGEDYDLPSFADHMAAIRANGHLPAVGPTPEDGPHNLSQMVGGTLNELEKAYLYIDRLDTENSALRGEVSELQAQLAHVLTRLDALETR